MALMISTPFNRFQRGHFNAFQPSFLITRPQFRLIRPLLINGNAVRELKFQRGNGNQK
jgi:hypothetical protein